MKIVLAYSGGLDTSVAIVWLKEKYNAEIVGFCSDVGQGEDLEAARKKALRTGAVSCHVVDQRDEFVRDYVFPALRAAAVYEGEYYLGTALARPCIAKGMMEVAAREGRDGHLRTARPARATTRCASSSAAYWFNPVDQDHRALARVGVQVALRADRVRGRQEDPGGGDVGQAVLDRPQPAAHQLRGRHPGGPGRRAAGRDVPAHRRSAQGPRRAARGGHRLREGHAGGGRRPAAGPGGAARRAEHASRASTAWGAPTWSRIASSA